MPDPDVLAAEIVENLEAALKEFRTISDDLTATETETITSKKSP